MYQQLAFFAFAYSVMAGRLDCAAVNVPLVELRTIWRKHWEPLRKGVGNEFNEFLGRAFQLSPGTSEETG